MRLGKLLLTLVLTVVIKVSFATDINGEKRPMSLKEVQDFAVQNSLTVKDGNYDLDIAKKKIWETTATGLPQVDAKLAYTHNPGKIPLFSLSDTIPGMPVGTKNTTVLTGTVSQLIFSGSYIVGLQSAKTYRQMVEQSLEKTKIDVKEAVTQSYYLILLTSETSAILKENIDNLKKTLDETEKMFEKGFAEETSVDQLRISVNDLELSASTTRKQELVARRLLNYQMGLPLDAEVELSDKLENIVLGINKDRILETPFTVEKNINFSMAETQIKVNKLLLKLEQSNYLPTIAGFYQYQKNLPTPVINFTPVNLLGLNVSLPIFSSGQRSSKVSQARMNVQKAELAREQATRGLNMEFLQTRDEFNTAWEKYLNSKSSLKLAQKVLKEVTIKFKNGVGTSTEVTQANDKLLQAISTQYSVEYDLLNAKLHLDKVTGNL